MSKSIYLLSGAVMGHLTGVLFLALFVVLFVASTFSQATETLDNSKIVLMEKAGFPDSVIVSKIRQSRVTLDISSEALIQLKNAGVSDHVILELMNRSKANGFQVPGPIENYFPVEYGTEVKVLNREKLTSKKLLTGQKLVLEVAEDVLVNGTPVILKGTPVSAVVVESRKSGMLGRSGRLAIFIESTQLINGEKIKLRAGKAGKSGDNMRSMFALTIMFGAPGLLMKGTNGQVPANSILIAQIDETRYIKR